MHQRGLSSQRVFYLVALFIVLLISGFLVYQNLNAQKRPYQVISKSSSINRNWEFAATDRSSTPLPTKIAFTLTNLERTNQIYVRNKPIRTTPERIFLVASIELKNDTDKRVYFYSSDYVRLVGADGKKFEADFRNPRLEVAPYSTKKDKLAFLVSAKDQSFELQIGEIAGSKESIPVSF